MKGVWAPVLSLLSLATARAEEEIAIPADAFVESVGVNTHWNYLNTPYRHFPELKDALVALGVRHIRDTPSSRLFELARVGIGTLLLADLYLGTPDENVAFIKTFNAVLPPAFDAVEGPNEPENFWDASETYRGQGFPQGVIAFQQDLYRAVKSDPETAHLPVYGVALGRTQAFGASNPLGNTGELEGSVDFGNFHPYPAGNPFNNPFAYGGIDRYFWNGNFPSAGLDRSPAPGLDSYDWLVRQARLPTGAKPLVATETAYSCFTNGSSERAHGLYTPRLLLEFFRLGIARTYLYQLIDDRYAPADRDKNFGLLRADLTRRPAFEALRNLLGLLADPGRAFVPGTLDRDFTVQAAGGYDRLSFVHHLLFQKRDGRFYFVFWHEVAIEDVSFAPYRQLYPPPLPAQLAVRGVFASANLYTWDDAGAMTRAEVSPAGSIPLEVTDRVSVVELVPSSFSESASRDFTVLQGASCGAAPSGVGAVTGAGLPLVLGAVLRSRMTSRSRRGPRRWDRRRTPTG